MQNTTPRQLIGRLQSLLKERKHNSETPLQAFIDYIKAEREVFELLLQIPQDPVKSEDHRIAEEVRDKMAAIGRAPTPSQSPTLL
jgi:hypothetical protein